jgi:hypothetical protein
MAVTTTTTATAERLSATAVRRPSLALLALAANLAIALPLAALLNLWQDEAYTLHTTGRDLAYAFAQAIGFEQNAPLYFLVMTLWRHAGESLFFLRLVSVICIAATVALVPALARRYVPAVDPGFVTAAVAVNPFAIWAAVEMRVYASIVLLSALLLLAFFDAFLSEKRSRSAALAYALCAALALYTQYYLAFLIAAQAIALLVYNRRAFAPFALAAGAAALAFAPLLAVVPGQVQNFKGAFAAPTLLHSFVTLAGIVLRYLLPLPFEHAKIAYGGIVAALAIAAVVTRKAFDGRALAPIVTIAGFAFLFFAAGTYAAGVHVLDRHAASLYLPATLSGFALLSLLKPPARRRAAAVWTCIAVGASLIALGVTYRALAKPGDWARATAFVRAHERPGEPIAVFEAENALPFAYYYGGSNRIVPIPEGVDFRRYDVSKFVVRGEAALAASMPQTARLWLVTAGECKASNIAFGCGLVEGYAARRYRVLLDRPFFGSRVRLLERRGPGR